MEKDIDLELRKNRNKIQIQISDDSGSGEIDIDDDDEFPKRKRKGKGKKRKRYRYRHNYSSSEEDDDDDEEDFENDYNDTEKSYYKKYKELKKVLKKRKRRNPIKRKKEKKKKGKDEINTQFIGSSHYEEILERLKRKPSQFSALFIRKVNEYAKYVKKDEVKFARYVAGLTSHRLGYVLMDVPDFDVSKLMGGFSSDRTLDTNIIYYNYDLIKNLDKEAGEIEHILDHMDKRISDSRLKNFKVTLNRNTIGLLDDDDDDDDDDAVDVGEDAVLDYVYKTSKRRKKLGMPSNVGVIKTKIGSNIDSRETGSVTFSEEFDGLLRRVKHKFRRMDQLINNRSYKTRKRFNGVGVFENIGKKISGVLKTKLTDLHSNFDLFSELKSRSIGAGISKEELTERDDEGDIVKQTVKQVTTTELDNLIDRRTMQKERIYSELNLKIRYQDFYEAHMIDALNMVRRAIGSNKVKKKHLIENEYTFVPFGKLVALKIKQERFNKSTRDPGGKYHAERVYEERLANPEYQSFIWFKRNIKFENGQIKLKKRLRDSSSSSNGFTTSAIGIIKQRVDEKRERVKKNPYRHFYD